VICWYSSGSISSQSHQSFFPPTSVGLILWTSTVCETVIGYRMLAYTILYTFARPFLVIFTNMLHIFMYLFQHVWENVSTNLYIVVSTLSKMYLLRTSQRLRRFASLFVWMAELGRGPTLPSTQNKASRVAARSQREERRKHSGLDALCENKGRKQEYPKK
jgi:hypothetical protein